MIDFAIISLPRSGTAWASNWLTTDSTACLHDPLANIGLDDIAALPKGVGVACTALWLHPDFVYRNIKRWVILERDTEEINDYACIANYPPLSDAAIALFRNLRGPRMDYRALFDKECARNIWEYLMPDVPFNEHRHSLLTQLIVTDKVCHV